MGAGIEKSRLEAEELLAHTLEVDRLNLYLDPDRPLTKAELDRYRPLIKKRKSGEPLQYITGKTSFMGVSLKIDDRALIPRPETEEMTEEILARFRHRSGLRVLDLGTGSGVIAIALARFLVNPRITAVDNSESALELAEENVAENEVSDAVEFRQSDWFSKVDEKYDIIVSNPPYVATQEIEELSPDIKEHEPLEALDGGSDGMKEIRRILGEVSGYLTEDGAFFLEISYNQGERVKGLISEGNFARVELIKDTGDKDRILFGKRRVKDVKNGSSS
ncbi:peptide chain release factor N(5)-glutamine methyltransferase [Candidatus Bipolaricaulota bacterium]|nr:peptide chain release factor N(5)-glutamine methyltransferase [Candidatus Bipolaricaulota bacterium]